MNKERVKKIAVTFLAVFLPAFMLLIFGPAEIFFANAAEFQFVYGEFAGALALAAFAVSIVLTLVTSFLPDAVHRVLVSVLFGASLSGYIQVMFLNKDLDLLGLNPEGYRAPGGRAAINILVWVLVIAAVTVFAFLKKKLWTKLVVFLSVALLGMQTAAYVSLVMSAQDAAFRRPEGRWHLTGEEQYTVSADKNVIVIVLDWFSNQYPEAVEAVYPGAMDCLHDFTYYNNADCVYFGTFPSLPHMLTGNDVDGTLSVDEWCRQCWENDTATSFYEALRKKGYKANVYTQDTNILCGLNNVNILDGRLSNVVDSAQDVAVDTKLLRTTMFKMAAYRMFPDLLKGRFYTNISEYADVVTAKDNPIMHNNFDFYQMMQEKGITADRSSNYFILQHLMGTHLYTTDAEGNRKEESTLEETAMGCMVIVNEYLNWLKQLGVYDDATIIITSDHGGYVDSQVIFYVKQPGETHDVSPVTDAPISFCELLPTIAQAAGLGSEDYGRTIYDFSAGEQRERTVWLRATDPDYPDVPCYTGEKAGDSNVYNGYTYTGTIEDLFKAIEEGPSRVMAVVDSYF